MAFGKDGLVNTSDLWNLVEHIKILYLQKYLVAFIKLVINQSLGDQVDSKFT